MVRKALKLSFITPPLAYAIALMVFAGSACMLPGYSCELGVDASSLEALILIFVGLLVGAFIVVTIVCVPLVRFLEKIRVLNLPVILIISAAVGIAPALLPCIFGSGCSRLLPVYIAGALAGIAAGGTFWLTYKKERTT